MNLSQTAEMPPLPPAKFPMALTITFLIIIAIISITGIIGPFEMATDMSLRGGIPGHVVPLLILGPLVTLGIDALLVWMLLRLLKIHHEFGVAPRVQSSRPPQPKEFAPPQLNAPPSAIGSVTEHTTRNFDEYEKNIRARQARRDTNEV
ncbi:MAG: hypothetical protein ACJ74J_16590 [Blastocatellia bacterium]|jgi:hypothetical protein